MSRYAFIVLVLLICSSQAQVFLPFSFWNLKGPWLPTHIGTSLYAWYDASNSASVRTGVAGVTQAVSGDPVSVWQDISGKGFHLDQTLAGRQPLFNSTAWKSTQPTIIWDATDDSLLNSSQVWQNYTIAAVIRHNSVSNVRAILTKRSAVSANFFWFTYSTTSNSVNWDQNGNRLDTGFVPTAGSYYLYVLVRPLTGTNRTKYVNGTSVSTSATNPNDSNANILYVGNDYSAANRGVDAYISELVIVSTDLPSNHREKLEGYLAWKWGLAGGLPAAHPYKAAAP